MEYTRARAAAVIRARALKKAMADPKHPDREVLQKIEPLMRATKTVKVEIGR